MSRGAACGPPFGMGWDVESSYGPGLGFPLGFGSSFGFRVSDWPIEGEYSTCVQLGSRGSCHFRGGATGQQVRPPPARPFDGAQDERPLPGQPRGFAPTCRSPAPRDGFRLSAAGMTGEKGVGGFLCMRRICGGGPPHARPFDGAQGEWPHPGRATGQSPLQGRD